MKAHLDSLVSSQKENVISHVKQLQDIDKEKIALDIFKEVEKWVLSKPSWSDVADQKYHVLNPIFAFLLYMKKKDCVAEIGKKLQDIWNKHDLGRFVLTLDNETGDIYIDTTSDIMVDMLRTLGYTNLTNEPNGKGNGKRLLITCISLENTREIGRILIEFIDKCPDKNCPIFYKIKDEYIFDAWIYE